MTDRSRCRGVQAVAVIFAAAGLLSTCGCQRPAEPTKAATGAAQPTTPANQESRAAGQNNQTQEAVRQPERGPDASAPWRPAGAKVTPLGPNIALGVAGERRWVEIQATVCLTAGYLEHLLSRDEAGKQHESILSTSIDASHIHAALIAAGAKPGKPVQFLNDKGEPDFRPPTGDRIRITLHYKDKSGQIVSVPAQRWVRNVKTKKELDQDWVFAGSFFFQPEGAEKPIYAANDGRVITTANFPSALLDLPMRSEEGDPQAGLEFEANTELIPPRETPVTVVLEVVKPDDPSPPPGGFVKRKALLNSRNPSMPIRSIELMFSGTLVLTGILTLAALMLTSAESAEEPQDRFFNPKPVTIDELKKFIAEQKGKVLILDLWSDTCTICKEEFPRLVKLHEKHAKDGLVAASLCLDRPTNEKAMRNARQFLTEQKARFPNFVINEEPAVWQERLGIDGPPVLFLFGRDGKLVKKYEPIDNDEGNTIYDKVEKLLPDLLQAKP